MPKTRVQKEETIENLADLLSQSKSAVFVNFQGLNVPEVQELRKKCRENGLKYMVAKKTLLKIALEKSGMSEVDLSAYTSGVGTIFGLEDEVAPAQAADNFSKEHEALTILGGVMIENPEGQKSLSLEAVQSLAKLPSKQVLLGQVVGTIKAPITGFVNVLAGNLRGLVNVLNAIKDQKA